MTDPPPIDMARLTAEINDEVRRRRAAGDFPPGLERELDELFARYSPAATGGTFEEVMARAEVQSFVHADVPIESRRALFSYVKSALRKLLAWYLRFLAQQVTAFAAAITRAVRLLGERVDALERATATERARREIGEIDSTHVLARWAPEVADHLARAPGRVLNADCGAGVLLARLGAAGLDVYGLEPSERLAMRAAQQGADVRSDDLTAHLRSLPEASLGGLVLSGGAVEVLPVGVLLELADLAASRLAPGGRLAIVSTGPGAWRTELGPVVADLAPGRPLSPETWLALLAAREFIDARAEADGPSEADGAGETDRLPASYVVLAARPSAAR